MRPKAAKYYKLHCSCRDVYFVCSNAVCRYSQLFPLQSSPFFVKYQAQPRGSYCWPIEIHIMSVCGLQATHRPTIVASLLRQSCLIKVSLLGGVWMANDGSLLEAGGASFVNFVKIEDFGG